MLIPMHWVAATIMMRTLRQSAQSSAAETEADAGQRKAGTAENPCEAPTGCSNGDDHER